MKTLPWLSMLLAVSLLSGCSYFQTNFNTLPIFEPAAKSKPAPPSSGTVEASDDGKSFWIKSGVETSERQADISNCYEFAVAQIARDEQIRGDRAGVGTQAGLGGEETAFVSGLDDYERGNQREDLFSRCMRAKGYTKT